MFLPIKTNDIVSHQGMKYIVNSVQLTGDGPVLELYPIRKAPSFVHASEVSFVDREETVRRAKSVGIKAINAQRQLDNSIASDENEEVSAPKGFVKIPEGIEDEREAEKILKMYSRRGY